MPIDSSTPHAMASDDPYPFAQVLASMVQKQSDASGEMILALWINLAANLVSLIGDEGFNALYSRSLHLAGATHPWLADLPALSGDRPRFAALASSLQDRSQEEVATAMVLLLSTFTGVLSTLIGQPLTTNILRAAWGDAYTEAAQEISTWPKK